MRKLLKNANGINESKIYCLIDMVHGFPHNDEFEMEMRVLKLILMEDENPAHFIRSKSLR